MARFILHFTISHSSLFIYKTVSHLEVQDPEGLCTPNTQCEDHPSWVFLSKKCTAHRSHTT